MSIEAVLRIILAVGAVSALGVGVAAYASAAQRRRAATVNALVCVWAVACLAAGLYGAVHIGQIARTEALLLALAPVVAVIGGAVSGRAKADKKKPAGVAAAFAALVLLDLAGFYRLNHALVEIAGALGFGSVRTVKYSPTADKDCPENLKSLYFAFAQYAEDNGALPPANGWMANQDIASKVQKEEWFHCPAVSNRHDANYGYAYNDALAGKALNGMKLNEIPDAARTPLLYDSSNLARSAHDAFTSLPKPGRHGGHNNVLYCDGHVGEQ